MNTQGVSFDKKAVEQLLGGDPWKASAQAVLACFIVALIVIGLLAAFQTGPGLAIAVLLCLLVVGGLTLQLPATLLNQRVIFRPAVAAVQSGAIVVDWAFQGDCGNGIVLVDESGQRLYVNGEVRPFADVKQIEWSTGGSAAYLRIILRSGENPVRTIRMQSHRSAAQNGHRLDNVVAAPDNADADPMITRHPEAAITPSS